jgi:hypothetical protein
LRISSARSSSATRFFSAPISKPCALN